MIQSSSFLTKAFLPVALLMGCEPQSQSMTPYGKPSDRPDGGGSGTDIPQPSEVPVTADSRPNIILILTDDQGYADIGCYGAKGFTTPNVDVMASIGMRFTDFYMASNLSTPSRAGIMTGCYPHRISMSKVLVAKDTIGLNSSEKTMAEMLKETGYATACIGKWHLGHSSLEALPCHHGFDYFFGLPYSVDINPHPLYRGDEILEQKPDINQLTTRYTENAVEYIKSHKDKPFFLYFAHSMPHVPLGVSDKFRGKSELGLYGDVIMEIDWSVGEVYKALRDCGILDNTLVIFTSDNGPWLKMGEHAGHADPLREGKATTFDGGHRVPCLATWPDVIPAGYVYSDIACSLDLFPTFAAISGGTLPPWGTDGENIMHIFKKDTPDGYVHSPIFFYGNNKINAVRDGDWKYHAEHGYIHVTVPGVGGKAGTVVTKNLTESLFNIRNNPEEDTNKLSGNKAIGESLKKTLTDFDTELQANKRPNQIYQ